MDSLTGSIAVKVNFTGAKTRDLGSLSWPVSFTDTTTFTYGIGANAVNEMFDDDRTLAGGANEELDLSGTLTNAFGDVIAFVGIKGLYIKNNSAVDTLTIGGAASAAWEPWTATGDVVKIPPGGVLVMTNPSAAGWAVAAGTTDKLKITNSAGGSTSYRIILVGDLVA